MDMGWVAPYGLGWVGSSYTKIGVFHSHVIGVFIIIILIYWNYKQTQPRMWFFRVEYTDVKRRYCTSCMTVYTSTSGTGNDQGRPWPWERHRSAVLRQKRAATYKAMKVPAASGMHAAELLERTVQQLSSPLTSIARRVLAILASSVNNPRGTFRLWVTPSQT